MARKSRSDGTINSLISNPNGVWFALKKLNAGGPSSSKSASGAAAEAFAAAGFAAIESALLALLLRGSKESRIWTSFDAYLAHFSAMRLPLSSRRIESTASWSVSSRTSIAFRAKEGLRERSLWQMRRAENITKAELKAKGD